MAKDSVSIITLPPSKMIPALEAMLRTKKRATFMWGGPGLGKSEISRQIADAHNMAFIDMRLSQMEPTDMRGVPYSDTYCGVSGVQWSVPSVLPRDLNLSWVEDVLEEETTFYFTKANPLGSNNIHYCLNPQISVKAIGKGKVARVIDSGLDWVKVALYSEDDVAFHTPIEGKVRINVVGKARGIIGLEEFNSAPPSVQAAAYQFVLDRRLGDYIVPDDCYIMGMGNRDTDKGITYKMATPIMNRFVHLELVHNFEDWQQWAIRNNIHSTVVGYLSHFNDKLYKFDPTSASRGFETPRSWSAVSDILKAEGNDDLEFAVMLSLVAGAIGDGTAREFMETKALTTDLPMVADVLSGKVKSIKKVQVVIQHMFVTSLCYELGKRQAEYIETHGDKGAFKKSKDYKDFNAAVDNYITFVIENMMPEIAIMSLRLALKAHDLLITDSTAWKAALTKYRHLMNPS